MGGNPRVRGPVSPVRAKRFRQVVRCEFGTSCVEEILDRARSHETRPCKGLRDNPQPKHERESEAERTYPERTHSSAAVRHAAQDTRKLFVRISVADKL